MYSLIISKTAMTVSISQCEDRIVEMVFCEDKQVFTNWLKNLVQELEIDEDGVILFTSYGGNRGGLMFCSDPVTKAAMVGFAITGGTWPRVFPELLNKLNKQWGKQSKKKIIPPQNQATEKEGKPSK